MSRHLTVCWITALVMLGIPLQSLSQCPSHVRKTAITADASKLPSDGYYAYIAASSKGSTGKIMCSRLKNGTPKEIGTGYGANRIWFSPDGKWLLHYPQAGNVKLVHPDGTGMTDLGITCKQATWFYSSPKENASAGIYEIATSDASATNVYAYIVDLSGTTPKLGVKRQIAEKLPASTEVFAVAKNHIYWDNGPSIMYTIPANGMASASTAYSSFEANMCAQSFTRDGAWGLANSDGYGSSCIPADHTGFFIVKVRDNTAPKVALKDWILSTTDGISVNWAPATAWGKDAKTGAWSTHDWNLWNMSNDPEWLIGAFNGNAGHGLFIIGWRTNTWIPIAGPSVSARWPAVQLDKAVQTVSPQKSTAIRQSVPGRASGLARWHDLIGRSAKSNSLVRAAVVGREAGRAQLRAVMDK